MANPGLNWIPLANSTLGGMAQSPPEGKSTWHHSSGLWCDSRPKELQIVEDENLVSQPGGKTAFFTGANQGFGIETSRAFHAAGATVFLVTQRCDQGPAGRRGHLGVGPV
ncbi:hypothetical protein B0J13DRAFT_529966 [Dactylonectria estremocensis]|uniref:Uncharacterized protein n=1 Tax=Dactylonectria estremocensis TaxID=1079267 RepID=A0A9P9E361_9HYPO|nr:hypothetical protein B0J13DRAFT_529966 [Dactylonectria estremocensis]